MANNINIRKSAFLKTNEKEKAVKAKKKSEKTIAKSEDSVKDVNVEPTVRVVDLTAFEIHLDNEMTVSIDLTKKTKYRLKNGCLYYGLFKKIGKVRFVRARI